MLVEYNSILSTPTEADNIGHFGQYRYIGETQILARYIGLSLVIMNLNQKYVLKLLFL